MSTDTFSDKQERAAKIITKLLALAEDDGATQAERQTAHAKAKALLNKHELSLDDIDQAEFTVTTIETEYKQAPGWFKILAVHVSKFLGLFVLYCKPRSYNQTYAQWRVSGRPQDIEIFKYMMDNIKRQIYDLADEWREEQRAKGRSVSRADTNSFRVGAMKRVGDRLNKMLEEMNEEPEDVEDETLDAEETPNTTALTLTEQSTAKRNKAKEVMRKNYGGWTSGSGVSHSGTGHAAGYQAGDRVTVRRATKKTSPTPQLT